MGHKKRVYLFGIGSPEWQERTGHTVNKQGVPIPTRKKSHKLFARRKPKDRKA